MPGRKVQFADTGEVLFALGIPEMQNPIPAGVIKMTNNLQIPVSLDVSYIAGPDTAHVNAAGISGNRKTSYLLFLLESAYQRLSSDGVSLIIFNTKEAELLQIDIERKKNSLWKTRGFTISWVLRYVHSLMSPTSCHEEVMEGPTRQSCPRTARHTRTSCRTSMIGLTFCFLILPIPCTTA
jgi:hypothetical protein